MTEIPSMWPCRAPSGRRATWASTGRADRGDPCLTAPSSATSPRSLPFQLWKDKSYKVLPVLGGQMGMQGRSLQDRIRERQQSGFVGRKGQVIQYQENFGFLVDDERRRFLFNIHGDAGVGKTFLTRQLRQIAAGAEALTAYIIADGRRISYSALSLGRSGLLSMPGKSRE